MSEASYPRRLRELRRRQGLTISELSEKSEVSEDAISWAERGVRQTHPSTLRKIAGALRVEVSELFEEPIAPLGEGAVTAAEWVEALSENEKKVVGLYVFGEIIPEVSRLSGWTRGEDFPQHTASTLVRARRMVLEAGLSPKKVRSEFVRTRPFFVERIVKSMVKHQDEAEEYFRRAQYEAFEEGA